MRLLPYGPEAVLVELADSDEVRAWHAAVRGLPEVLDLVPAGQTLLLVCRPDRLDRVCAELRRLDPAPVPARAGERVSIEVCYDGADLSAVAEATGLSEREVVARHCRSDFVVAYLGFAPGFAYLTGLDPALRLPRRGTPRTRVPAGSVAIADTLSAVYPRASPGGWHLLGRTEQTMFDPYGDPPALLTAGTRVRFVAT